MAGTRAWGEDDMGRNRLHVAAMACDADECRRLLMEDRSLIFSRAEKLLNNSPLHFACSSGWDWRGSEETTEAAEEESNVNAGHKEGFISETEATRRDRGATVDLFLEFSADVTAKNNMGNTPLHLASACGDLNTVRKLCMAKADVNSRSHKGRTPLFIAAENGSREVLAFLLNNKADVSILADGEEGVLHAAARCKKCHPDTIQWLLDAGAGVHARAGDLKTPLKLATENVLDSLIEGLFSKVSCLLSMPDEMIMATRSHFGRKMRRLGRNLIGAILAFEYFSD
eukprot:748704-Hanusia_phi.AAC.3